MQEYKLYIDGQFCDADGGKTADSINPATEEPWARIARASVKDTERAIAAARKAFDDGPWPRMSQADRKRILNQIADGLEATRQEIAAVEFTSTMRASFTGLPLSSDSSSASSSPRA